MGHTGLEQAGTISFGPEEQDLTPARIIARAAAMRDGLREQAELAEKAGGYSAELHAKFTDAGFYRILQPKRFGGYEFGLDTFFRVVIEISRGDPGIGWNLCLAAGHVFQLASFYPEQAQADVLGPDGHFAAPGRTSPTGSATVVDGGYRISGRWDYCSGITHATHLMAVAVAPHPEDPERRIPVSFVLPRKHITVLDDWGGGATIGLQASGSNTVVVEDAFVPAHHVVPYDWKDFRIPPEGTPGYRIHGNPMYLGRPLGFFNGELVATQVGTALAALDEYEHIVRTRKTSFPPPVPRADSPDVQRWLGQALSGTDAAHTLLLAATDQYLERCRSWAAGEGDFTSEDDARIRGVMLHAAQLAWSAVDLMFATGGTSAAKRGSRLERYYRDGSMFRTHIAAQYDYVAGSTARLHLHGGSLAF